ncbi:hypothetical protein CHH28_09915 [Bacterioplanes sanyensis]|uniref:Cyclophilin TM1367-like domain-containing protein n=2 Tax=Bacterioplanes sanyensis TaxID=1249553 RepID=A0A222FPF4_9GAMM|nr:hypothetical protein CHH28_09915 [Bacterioplanes sanyensis]
MIRLKFHSPDPQGQSKARHIRVALRRTPTADAILRALPFSAKVQTWGQEVMFDCPIRAHREDNAVNVVKAGDMAFWADGSCIAIGFGPTPISRYGEIRLASQCNIWGDALDDVSLLASIAAGTEVHVEHDQDERT